MAAARSIVAGLPLPGCASARPRAGGRIFVARAAPAGASPPAPELGVFRREVHGMVKEQMERIYRDVPPDRIPWNFATPPEVLQRALEANAPPKGKIVELGCGAGNYVVWFAKRGYAATGVDISENAIGLARRCAADAGVACTFIAADVTRNLAGIDATFDFAYDWELLHHIFPEDREGYVRRVVRLLKPGAKYLSVCFSEDSPQFGGVGKYRRTPLGTTLYFSTEAELRELFQRHFDIEEMRTIDVRGRNATHKAIYALMADRRRPARP